MNIKQIKKLQKVFNEANEFSSKRKIAKQPFLEIMKENISKEEKLIKLWKLQNKNMDFFIVKQDEQHIFIDPVVKFDEDVIFNELLGIKIKKII